MYANVSFVIIRKWRSLTYRVRSGSCDVLGAVAFEEPKRSALSRENEEEMQLKRLHF